VPQSYYFCIKNALKLTYDHLYFKKKFVGSLSLAMKGRDNKGRKGRGVEGRGRRQGRGRKGRGEEGKGKVKGLQPPKFGTLSSPLLSVNRTFDSIDCCSQYNSAINL
jgi:hypothetical protein